MVRREVVRRLPVSGVLCACCVFALVVSLLGCSHDQQARLQSGDDAEHERYGLKTIGDVTTVANAQPLPVGGVGLVVGLEGNGGDCPPDDYRKLLESDLHKQGIKDVKKILADPDNALVLISGQIPPGARIGDPIDLDIRLPARSQARSLRGGVLKTCYLFSFASTHQLMPGYNGAETILRGQVFARAEGPILVGFNNNGDETSQQKQGRIWAGGICRKENPFGLVLAPNQQFKARMTDRVANQINERFQGAAKGDPTNALAIPKTPESIDLRVPAQYRLNLNRYLLVSRLIPLQNPGEQTGGGLPYRQRLGEDLLDPARCVTAAMRLEAVGQDALPQLKAGLTSSNELVRFCSAEALAYLGNAVAAEELGRQVVNRPVFRAFALTALASLDENASRRQLEELLESDHDDETRYGAFRALRALEEDHPAVAGTLLNKSFWLHRIVPNTPSLVHLSSTQRAEIVLFGGDVVLKPPFSFLAGEYNIRAEENDDHCTVTYVPLRTEFRAGEPRNGVATRQTCALKLEDILITMTDLGAQYPEAVELIQQAESIHALNCRVARDALPQALSEGDLAALGRVRPGEPVPDLGSTPTLFDTGRRRSAGPPLSEPSTAEEPRQRIIGLE